MSLYVKIVSKSLLSILSIYVTLLWRTERFNFYNGNPHWIVINSKCKSTLPSFYINSNYANFSILENPASFDILNEQQEEQEIQVDLK